MPPRPPPAALQFTMRLSQLAMARWWQELLDRSIGSLQLELNQLHGFTNWVADLTNTDWQVRRCVHAPHMQHAPALAGWLVDGCHAGL